MSRDLTLAQIEKLLARKRTQLESLNKQRDKLRRTIKAVDSRIELLGGDVTAASRPRMKRPKNARPLYDVVVDVLQEHKHGLTIAELAQAVLATGYKSNSVKFANPVYQCLYNASDTIVRDPGTQRYRLK